MKATIFLQYRDETEVCFEFNCDEVRSRALAVLMMMCRGTLMASTADKITAYNEEGFEYFSYIK